MNRVKSIYCWKCSHVVPARKCISAPSLVFPLLSHQHTSQLCSLSNEFPVSCIPRLMLFDTLSVSCPAQIVSQLSGGSGRVSNLVSTQATSRNQLCVTKIEIGDSWRNKMYIERVDILYSVELLDQSLMRSFTFNPFIDEIFALPFDIYHKIVHKDRPTSTWCSSKCLVTLEILTWVPWKFELPPRTTLYLGLLSQFFHFLGGLIVS